MDQEIGKDKCGKAMERLSRNSPLFVLTMAILSAAILTADTNSFARMPEQVIVVGLEKDMGSLDAGSVGGMWTLTFLVYDPLVHLSRDLKKVPGLAESWTMSADGKTWTFNLRKGVKFHDGTPFDVENVRWTIERNKKGNFPKYGYHLVQEMETPDRHTIIFHLSKPCHSFASDMTMAFNSIRNPAAYDKDGRAIKAVGTGPFKLSEWVPGQQVVFVRNNDYWGGKPKLEKLIFKVIPDPETRVMALETGQIDVMFGQALAPAHLQILKSNKNIKVIEQTSTNSSVIFFNARKAPFDDVRVRRAINYAIDLEGLVPKLLTGVAMPSRYLFSSAFKAYINPDARNYGYDPLKAKRLLAEAGWGDTDGDGIMDRGGQRLEMTMTYDANNAGYRLLAEPIQAQLKDVGIDVKLNKVEFGVYYKLLKNKKFDLMLVGQWYIPHDDPWQVYKNYYTSIGFRSVAEDPEVEILARRLENEMDSQNRLKLHHALQKEIMDKALAVYIFYNKNLWPMKKTVQDFRPYTDFWRQYKPLEKAYIQ